MNNVVWMVVKDEEFYISMAIESVINHVQDEGGLFILDTGSMDNTVELILSYQFLNPGKIVLEQQDFGSNDFKPGDFRFASGFREMDARNYALKRAVEMSDPDGWVICLDGDEVYNDRFWDVLDTIEEDALIYIGTLPINPYLASNHPLDVQEINGVKLFDPHLKVWRAGIPVKWVQRDENSNIHGKLEWEKPPKIYISQEHLNFHLHYSFGAKSIYSYMTPYQNAKDASMDLLIPLDQLWNQKYFENKWSNWFENGRFKPKNLKESIEWNKNLQFSIPLTHPMPDYVVDRWKQWGDWIE